MREILINCAFQVSKKTLGSSDFVPAKQADNVAPLPDMFNYFLLTFTIDAYSC